MQIIRRVLFYTLCATIACISLSCSASPVQNMLTLQPEDIHRGTLVLVNAEHPYTFPSFTMLAALYPYKSNTYQIKSTELLVSPQIVAPLNAMLNDFYAETGLTNVNVVSGYRSYNYQQTLFARRVEQYGERENTNGLQHMHMNMDLLYAIRHPKQHKRVSFTSLGTFVT